MKNKFLPFVIIVALIIIMFGMRRCVNNKITKASVAVAQRDYKTAQKEILSLFDKTILDSDTLLQLLSTAYYGSYLKPTRNIAVDCYDVDFISDNKQVVFTDFHNATLYFYSFPDMKFIKPLSLDCKAYAIDFSPNGEIFAAATVNKEVVIYETSTGKRLKELQGHRSRVRDVVFRNDECLYSCSNDQDVAAWNVVTGQRYWKRHVHSKNIKNLQLSNDKSVLITASNDGSASLLTVSGDSIATDELRFVHGQNYVNDAAISPDKKYAVTVSGDGCAKIWDAESESLIHYLSLEEPLSSVDISDNSDFILVGGTRTVFLIDAENAAIISKINVMGQPVWSVKFIDNNHFAFADNTHFWHADLLIGEDLIKEARKAAK